MFESSKEYAFAAAGSIRRWARSEDGAVTVDWVVLTATLAVIGGIIVTMTVDGTTSVGTQVGDILADKPVSE